MSLHYAGPRAGPAICLDRLSTDGAGQAVYRLKHPFRDGTTHVLLSPEGFIITLCPHCGGRLRVIAGGRLRGGPPPHVTNPVVIRQPTNSSRFAMGNTTSDATLPSAGSLGCFDRPCCLHRIPSSRGLSLLLLRPVGPAGSHQAFPIIRRVAFLEHRLEHCVGVGFATG